MVLAGANARATVRVEDYLHTLKQFSWHNWFVPTWIPNALILDFTNVIAIAKHSPKRRLRDRSFWLLVRTVYRQTVIDHNLVQCFFGVLTGGKKGKCFEY